MKVCITLGELPDGTFKCLYLGSDAAEAIKALPAAGDKTYVEACMFRKPVHHKRRLSGSRLIIHSPSHDEIMAERKAEAERAKTPEELRARIEARGSALAALAPEALKAAALKAGFNADELSQLPEDEIQSEAIAFILEKEFKADAVRLGVHPEDNDPTAAEKAAAEKAAAEKAAAEKAAAEKAAAEKAAAEKAAAEKAADPDTELEKKAAGDSRQDAGENAGETDKAKGTLSNPKKK